MITGASTCSFKGLIAPSRDRSINWVSFATELSLSPRLLKLSNDRL